MAKEAPPKMKGGASVSETKTKDKINGALDRFYKSVFNVCGWSLPDSYDVFGLCQYVPKGGLGPREGNL